MKSPIVAIAGYIATTLLLVALTFAIATIVGYFAARGRQRFHRQGIWLVITVLAAFASMAIVWTRQFK